MDQNDFDYDDYDIYDYDDYEDYDEEVSEDDEQQVSAPPPSPRPTKKRTRIRWGSVAVAAMILILIILLIYLILNFKNEKEKEHNSSFGGTSVSGSGDDIPAGAQTTITDSLSPNDSETYSSSDPDSSSEPEPPFPVKADLSVIDGVTYINGIVIINKTYSVPESYDPGVDPVAYTKLEEMYAAAADDGLILWTASGYRTYDYQRQLYEEYAARDGYEAADRYSARPGHSEHESGLTFDVNNPSDSFNGTPEAIWLEQHCAEYGFIIRYPEGKEDITGFKYESWHVRYVGEDVAKAIMENGICLEEYFGITSEYAE